MPDRRRLWRAENQNISIEGNPFGRTYFVNGARGERYTVDLEKPSCECPDWQKRLPEGGCKHMLKIKLNNGTVDPLRGQNTTTPLSQRNYSKGWQLLSERTKNRDNWECQRCGIKGGEDGSSTLHAHHMLPISEGGEDTFSNLITVCHECHEEIHGHPIPSPSSDNLAKSNSEDRNNTQRSQADTNPETGKAGLNSTQSPNNEERGGDTTVNLSGSSAETSDEEGGYSDNPSECDVKSTPPQQTSSQGQDTKPNQGNVGGSWALYLSMVMISIIVLKQPPAFELTQLKGISLSFYYTLCFLSMRK